MKQGDAIEEWMLDQMRRLTRQAIAWPLWIVRAGIMKYYIPDLPPNNNNYPPPDAAPGNYVLEH